MNDFEFQEATHDLMLAAERIHRLRHPLEPSSMVGLCIATADALGIEMPVPWWLWHMTNQVIREVRYGSS